MKSVVFYVNHFGNGGVDRHICNLANELNERGYDISILVRGSILIDRLYRLDKRIHVLSLRESHKGLSNLDKLKLQIMRMNRNVQWVIARTQQSIRERLNFDSFDAREKRRMIEREKTVINEYKNDTLHLLRFVNENRDSIYIFFSVSVLEHFCYTTKELDLKMIYAEARDPSRRTLNKSIMIALLSKINACVVQTETQARLYREIIKQSWKIHTVYNPMPEITIMHDSSKSREKVIVNFCRMDPAKNLRLLVDSFCMLNESYPDYKLELYVIADYEAAKKEKNELINYCKRKDSAGNIFIFSGEKNILKKIVDYSMFVSSSLHEGLSNSMLEAMSIGLPCVCTDCDGGGAREVIIDGVNGVLVQSDDITALYVGMKKIIENPLLAEKMGAQARRIKEKTNILEVTTRWEAIFDDIDLNR